MARKKQKRTTKKDLRPKRPVWVKGFLAAFRRTGIVGSACEAVKIGRTVAYKLRNSDQTFAAEWEEAREDAADLLEEEARRRAHEGVRRLRFHKGELIMCPLIDADGRIVFDEKNAPVMVPYTEHEHSDVLAIFLLKGLRPEKFRENVRTELAGDPKNPVKVDGPAASLTGQVDSLAAALLSAASREQGGPRPPDSPK